MRDYLIILFCPCIVCTWFILCVVAGVGFKILVGGLGVTLLGFEWLVAVLTQPRKDDMDDYDYDNFFVNMLDGS